MYLIRMKHHNAAIVFTTKLIEYFQWIIYYKDITKNIYNTSEGIKNKNIIHNKNKCTLNKIKEMLQ